MNKITKAITYSIATLGAVLGLSEGAAFARQEYYYIQARHSGQCLNVLNSGQQNGDNVVQGDECESPNFQWAIIPAGNGYYYIQARHSGQCLNVLNSGRNNADNVVQGDECKSPNFQWAIISQGKRLNYIEARHSGQCLNVLNSGQQNGDNVVQGYECRSDNFQWSIIPVRSFKSNNRNRNYHRDRSQEQLNRSIHILQNRKK